MRADSIGSSGRTGVVTALSIGTSGRMAFIGEILVTWIRTEIIRLAGGVSALVRLRSGWR